MRVLIAGAGIGRLTAALSLHAAGIEATVIEGARELRRHRRRQLMPAPGS